MPTADRQSSFPNASFADAHFAPAAFAHSLEALSRAAPVQPDELRASQSAARDRIQSVARQWHHLAERRVAYYNELYRSGRWVRYYASQREFAQRMLDVIKVAKTFAQAAGVDAAPIGMGQTEMPPTGDDLRPAA